MGFKTQVFNLPVLTQTEFENPQKSNFRPKKGHFLFYFNRATVLYLNHFIHHLSLVKHFVQKTKILTLFLLSSTDYGRPERK